MLEQQNNSRNTDKGKKETEKQVAVRGGLAQRQTHRDSDGSYRHVVFY
jgi:hypothetical protein